MQLNALHMRFGAIGGGILLLVGFSIFGGSWGGEAVVQIDFSIDPEFCEGLEVAIDDEVVGRLTMHGNVARTGFEVERGEHSVLVRHPSMGSEPATVTLAGPGQKTRLMLQIDSRYDSELGRDRPTLFFDW